MKEEGKNFENIVTLIKSLIWPILIIVFFFSYKTEFNTMVSYLPEMLKKSSKVTVGGISIEVQNFAEKSGNPELAKIIPTLSDEGIKTLLTIGEGRHMVLSRQGDSLFHLTEKISSYNELDINGLLTASYGYNNAYVPIINFLKDYSDLNLSELDYPIESGKIEGLKSRRLSMGIRKKDVSEVIWNRLNNFGVELNSDGKKVYDIIIEVVSKELSKN